jgi:copper homeostasis protein
VGGTTPSYGTIKKSKETLPVPFMVMIRPRGGDFVYTGKVTNENFEQVKSMVPSDEFHGRELVGNIAL